MKVDSKTGGTLNINGKDIVGMIKEEFDSKYTVEEIETIKSARNDGDARYERDCIRLYYLAKRQLNLEKNAKKGDFENLTLRGIKELYLQEYFELHAELFEQIHPFILEQKKKINYQRAREEIGDVAACLVGLLAKLNKMEKEEK